MFQVNRVTILYLLVLSSLFIRTTATAEVQIEQTLIQRISKSQQELSNIEKDIGNKSRDLSRQLAKKEEEIIALRSEAAGAQRLIDEQLLGVDQLVTRVEKWQTQSVYQAHLLNSFADAVALDKKKLPTNGTETRADINLLAVALDHINNRLNPQWEIQPLVSAHGEISDSPTLKVGPIELAFDPQLKLGGPVLRSANGESKVLDIFDNNQKSMLNTLYQQSVGNLIVDPTLGNAYELLKSDEKLLTHLDKGGVWAFPIIIFGLLSLIIGLLKAIQFFRLPTVDPSLADKITSKLDEAKNAGQPPAEQLKQIIRSVVNPLNTAQAKLAEIAVTTPISQHRDDLLIANLMEFKHKLERNLGIIATSASIAPLLGLLGTVSGMISTFKLMTIFGSGDASTVSGGISEALITTELGLIVAIPSLVVSALLTRKIRSYYHQLETFAIKLSKINFE